MSSGTLTVRACSVCGWPSPMLRGETVCVECEKERAPAPAPPEAPSTDPLVTFADLVALAKERDAFLAADPGNALLHRMQAGRHVVGLLLAIEGTVTAEGDHYWSALRDALRQLREQRKERVDEPAGS